MMVSLKGAGRRHENELLGRITVDPAVFGGKPIIRRMRIKVENVLSLLAQGASNDEILIDFPDLEPDDIRACLAYARALVCNESLEAVTVENAP